jgi:hypothetical protein
VKVWRERARRAGAGGASGPRTPWRRSRHRRCGGPSRPSGRQRTFQRTPSAVRILWMLTSASTSSRPARAARAPREGAAQAHPLTKGARAGTAAPRGRLGRPGSRAPPASGRVAQRAPAGRGLLGDRQALGHLGDGKQAGAHLLAHVPGTGRDQRGSDNLSKRIRPREPRDMSPPSDSAQGASGSAAVLPPNEGWNGSRLWLP